MTTKIDFPDRSFAIIKQKSPVSKADRGNGKTLLKTGISQAKNLTSKLFFPVLR